MNIDRNFFNRHDFKISFLKSLFLHVPIIGVIFLLAQVKFMKQSDIIAENVRLIESSVRVDLVGMPTQTLQELEALSRQVPLNQDAKIEAPKPEPVQATAPPEVVVENQTEYLVESEEAPTEDVDDIKDQDTSVDDFFSMLRQRSESDFPAPREETAQERSQRVEQERARQRLQELVLRGNQVSEGVALVGSGSEQASDEFVIYLQSLPDQIRPHWSLPRFLQDQELRTLIRIYISDTGRLMRADVYETSGNNEFDQRAMRAVRQAEPFPPPNDNFRSRLSRGDVILAFPL